LGHRKAAPIKWLGFQFATITATPVDSSKFDFNIRLAMAPQLPSDADQKMTPRERRVLAQSRDSPKHGRQPRPGVRFAVWTIVKTIADCSLALGYGTAA
jgi:hypothetical protein